MPGLLIASTHLLPPRNTFKVGPAKMPYDFEMMGFCTHKWAVIRGPLRRQDACAMCEVWSCPVMKRRRLCGSPRCFWRIKGDRNNGMAASNFPFTSLIPHHPRSSSVHLFCLFVFKKKKNVAFTEETIFVCALFFFNYYYYWIHVCLWNEVMERGIVVLWCMRDRARRSAHSDRLCRFMQTCMWPLCVAKSQGDARSGARWSFCCLHGVLRPGLPSKIASEATAMNEHRQRSPSSHLPPHYIAIHVESVDPQPDGGKSVHTVTLWWRWGSRNPSPATPLLCYEAQIFHITRW